MASIVLGVAGGIAAYKACELLRRLTEAGHDVRVVPTESALQFVGAATWAALSGRPVTSDLMADVHEVPHVQIGQQADLVAVVPTTANVMAKAASGIADDLLTNVLLTARCPVIMAPAMHTEMWEHPATVANVAALRRRGVLVVEPAVGRLTGVDSGKGRLPEPEQLMELIEGQLLKQGQRGRDLLGRRVLITAGGTREPIDPVRFIGNRSSGRQGLALAAAAVARGAQVDLVAANIALPTPAGVDVVEVSTAAELKEAVMNRHDLADAVVMAAAVADFRPSATVAHKLKKGDGPPVLTFEPTDDVLAAVLHARQQSNRQQVVVGFAAETGDEGGDWLQRGREKLARKQCDLLVVNRVGDGLAFGTTENAAMLIGRDGSQIDIPMGPKRSLADIVWDQVASRWPVDARVDPSH
jgi:phosphopantothenoylcysteine decarboxylase/phosphopantothenate--cysteine ligase